MKITESEKFLNSFEIQNRLSHAVNYNNWIYGNIEKYIGSRILEVGCALGNFTSKLINREFVCPIDIEEAYIEAVKKRFSGASNLLAEKLDISSPSALRLKTHNFDTVLCFNVLEHINDDTTALRNMNQLLVVSGHLCLVVPAFQCIFGRMDKTDNHYRRYDKAYLGKKMKEAGFNTLDFRYMNMPGFFGWWLNGRILRKRFIPFRQMMAYDRVVPFISRLEKSVVPLFGQSLVAVGKK